MTRRRGFDAADPTFLGLVFSFACMYQVSAPWERAWRFTPTEEPWLHLVLPQAVAVLLLTKGRSALAWAAAAAGLLGWSRSDSLRWHDLAAWEPFERLSDAAGSGIVGRGAFWLLAVIVCGAAVRAASRVDWGTALARSGIALVGSLAASEAVFWLLELRPTRSRVLVDVAHVSAFLIPAVALPALLWRSWPRLVAWTGACLASITLTAILLFDAGRLTPAGAAAASALLALGPVWAYLDWRRAQAVEPERRGFEVLLAPS
jgi:hypothetical protein